MIAHGAVSTNGTARSRCSTDINLSVRAGEKIVLCGPSGSGKSTLIRCINRLESYQKGEIVVDGIDLDGRQRKTIDAVRARGRHGVPAVQPVPAPDGAGELHAGADALARHDAARQAEDDRATTARRASRSSSRPTNTRRSSPAASSSASRSRARCAWSPRSMLFDEPTSALDPGDGQGGARHHDRRWPTTA